MSEPRKTFIHPTAMVEDPGDIGEGSSVWHFCHVMAGARVGRACTLGQGVFVARGAIIGDRVKIQNNVSIYDGVELGDDVFCGPSCVFTNVKNPRSHHPRRGEYQKTLIKKGATIGANATLLPGVTVGTYALVAAGAVVTRDVGESWVVMGVPARFHGFVCVCGETLSQDGNPAREGQVTCSRCHSRYEVDDGGLVVRGIEP
jgi:UDP-2-acetamido-3-amino-2,3-dideoxy-glucuronate N-acetyltransferase